MKLKINDRALFRAFDGKLISGIIFAIAPNCYIVLSDEHSCTMYNDGMYRFTDDNFIKILGKNECVHYQ